MSVPIKTATGTLKRITKDNNRVIVNVYGTGTPFEPQSGETLVVQPPILQEYTPKWLMRLP